MFKRLNHLSRSSLNSTLCPMYCFKSRLNDTQFCWWRHRGRLAGCYLAINLPNFKSVDEELPELEPQVSHRFIIEIVSRKKRFFKVLVPPQINFRWNFSVSKSRYVYEISQHFFRYFKALLLPDLSVWLTISFWLFSSAWIEVTQTQTQFPPPPKKKKTEINAHAHRLHMRRLHHLRRWCECPSCACVFTL